MILFSLFSLKVNYTYFAIFYSNCPTVCSMYLHFQIIQLYFKIALYHFMAVWVPYNNKILLTIYMCACVYVCLKSL